VALKIKAVAEEAWKAAGSLQPSTFPAQTWTPIYWFWGELNREIIEKYIKKYGEEHGRKHGQEVSRKLGYRLMAMAAEMIAGDLQQFRS